MSNYAVADLPGRGRGVLAKRRLKRGDVLIWEEPPLVRITPEIGRPRVHWFDDEQRMRCLMSTLSKDAGPPLKWTWFDKDLDAVVNTNSFTQVHAGEIHSYVFDQISRFNHSCSPNVLRASLGPYLVLRTLCPVRAFG